jgi:hypothetical protein
MFVVMVLVRVESGFHVTSKRLLNFNYALLLLLLSSSLLLLTVVVVVVVDVDLFPKLEDDVGNELGQYV